MIKDAPCPPKIFWSKLKLNLLVILIDRFLVILEFVPAEVLSGPWAFAIVSSLFHVIDIGSTVRSRDLRGLVWGLPGYTLRLNSDTDYADLPRTLLTRCPSEHRRGLRRHRPQRGSDAEAIRSNLLNRSQPLGNCQWLEAGLLPSSLKSI
jgi:hypothetical protein